MSMTTLNIGICGLGTVGASTVKILQQQRELLHQRTGRDLQVWAVNARNRNKDRGQELSLALEGILWVDTPQELAKITELDMVVELMGGVDAAYDVVKTALEHGKHVVTANKALIAERGHELAKLAEQHGVALAFEAAVAGGIPAIKVLGEGLNANHVTNLYGILNGTCNYILTTMASTGAAFDATLAEAQALGYAEADPTFDVDGIDAAHKLAILNAIAQGCPPDTSLSHIEGIRQVSAADVRFAAKLGYAIRLLGIGRQEARKLVQWVYPCLVPAESVIGKVDGVTNAVVIAGDAVGEIAIQGPGAGGDATASAVVADIADIAAGRFAQPFGKRIADLATLPALSISERVGQYYLRLQVADRAGVVGEITSALGAANISIEHLWQEQAAEGSATLIIVTHQAKEAAVDTALAAIGKGDFLQQPVVRLRIEEF